MSAPLYDALRALAGTDPLRMHMPGHKGRPIAGHFAGAAAIDFTELPGTGNLYLADGPIHEAELSFARFAGAERCCFLTGGSTLGLYAMLAAAARPGERVLLDRGSHKAAYNACAVLGLEAEYLYAPLLSPFGIASGITPEALDAALEKGRFRAVLVTSPTYYGICLPLRELAETAHRHGVLLLVDGAHGAHFPAVGLPSACALGADAEVCSAHKTLPALGQTALLYSSASLEAPLRGAASVFGTSSPSYLLMASMDLGRDALEGADGVRYRAAAEKTDALRRQLLQETPFLPLTPELAGRPLDPCRLTVCTAAGGLTGFEAEALLRGKHGVYCEMADDRNLVFILTCADTPADFDRLRGALAALPFSGGGLLPPPEETPRAQRILSLREAFFSPKEEVLQAEAEGAVCGGLFAPYPPGIPILAYGEKIEKIHLAYLRKKRYNREGKLSVLRLSGRAVQ